MSEKVLFICGSLNQTTMMHKISLHLQDYECFFTPFYADGLVGQLSEIGVLGFTILGGQHRIDTDKYLKDNSLPVDFGGYANAYDLVITGTDTYIQKNISNCPIVLIQEGIMASEGLFYHLVKNLNLPRYLANTATTGLSHAYSYFCVASKGYRDYFINKGIPDEKIIVTGIPNFDNVAQYYQNDFPHHHYVLAATSPLREGFTIENRHEFIRKVKKIAGGKQVIFKLHPLEEKDRAIREIKEILPEAIIFTSGNTNHMIANCDVLVTQYSSVTFIGASMGKEVHTELDLDEVIKLLPEQNGGTSAEKIAALCRNVLITEDVTASELANAESDSPTVHRIH